jgi:hypothetical protein
VHKHIMEKWTEALRSGKYTQTENCLRYQENNDIQNYPTTRTGGPTSYCCLGVLCDLASKEGYGAWDENNAFHGSDNDTSRTELPETVAAWADLSVVSPKAETDGFEWCLTEMNDELRLSFSEIADAIEDSWEKM